jgi:ketosteroid isomerase-like protein
MASANLELVRSIFVAWDRGDFSQIEWADPDIEFAIADGPAPGSWRGLRGMSDGFSGLVDAWKDYRVEAEEYVELDKQRVLVFLHPTGRGRTSGLDIGQTAAAQANLFQLRNGKVTRLVLYLDRDRAVAELGLASDG